MDRVFVGFEWERGGALEGWLNAINHFFLYSPDIINSFLATHSLLESIVRFCKNNTVISILLLYIYFGVLNRFQPRINKPVLTYERMRKSYVRFGRGRVLLTSGIRQKT